MNWTVVVVAAIVVISGLNWVLFARHTFRGPKRVDLLPDPAAPAQESTDQEAACPIVLMPHASGADQGMGPDVVVGDAPPSILVGSA